MPSRKDALVKTIAPHHKKGRWVHIHADIEPDVGNEIIELCRQANWYVSDFIKMAVSLALPTLKRRSIQIGKARKEAEERLALEADAILAASESAEATWETTTKS